MLYRLIMRSAGMYGYVIASDLILEFNQRPTVDTVHGILDALTGQLKREVANVKFTTVSTQGTETFDARVFGTSIFATVAICYDGQEVPSTEINFEFFIAQPYHFWKNQPDFTALARFLTNVNKELEL